MRANSKKTHLLFVQMSSSLNILAYKFNQVRPSAIASDGNDSYPEAILDLKESKSQEMSAMADAEVETLIHKIDIDLLHSRHAIVPKIKKNLMW